MWPRILPEHCITLTPYLWGRGEWEQREKMDSESIPSIYKLPTGQVWRSQRSWVSPTCCSYKIRLPPKTSTSRDSDWLRAERQRGRSLRPCWAKNFLFSTSSRPALGSTQPPIQWLARLIPGGKAPGCEADHSPPAIAEVKIMWIYTSTPHTPVLN
jgi:hypothetical protein